MELDAAELLGVTMLESGDALGLRLKAAQAIRRRLHVQPSQEVLVQLIAYRQRMLAPGAPAGPSGTKDGLPEPPAAARPPDRKPGASLEPHEAYLDAVEEFLTTNQAGHQLFLPRHLQRAITELQEWLNSMRPTR